MLKGRPETLLKMLLAVQVGRFYTLLWKSGVCYRWEWYDGFSYACAYSIESWR